MSQRIDEDELARKLEQEVDKDRIIDAGDDAQNSFNDPYASPRAVDGLKQGISHTASPSVGDIVG